MKQSRRLIAVHALTVSAKQKHAIEKPGVAYMEVRGILEDVPVDRAGLEHAVGRVSRQDVTKACFSYRQDGLLSHANR